MNVKMEEERIGTGLASAAAASAMKACGSRGVAAARIAVAHGDGVGVEITRSVIEILEA